MQSGPKSKICRGPDEFMSEEKRKHIDKMQSMRLHFVGWAGTSKFALDRGFNSKEGDRVRKCVRTLGGHTFYKSQLFCFFGT